jgi:hypothetical protein
VNPVPAHPASPEGGNPFGTVPIEEPARELRGFPLGTILLRLGVVAEGPINEALGESGTSQKPLGRFLVDRGILDEAQLARALAIQKGLPFVPLEQATQDPRAVALLSAHAANRLGALPLGYVGVVPVVAIGDPTDKDAIDEICATVGAEVMIAAACPVKLKEALVSAYRQDGEPAPVVSIVPAPPPAPEPAETAFRIVASIGPERVEVDRCPNRAAAQERAKALVTELASGTWISCDDRLVRADAVTSIEILEVPRRG